MPESQPEGLKSNPPEEINYDEMRENLREDDSLGLIRDLIEEQAVIKIEGSLHLNVKPLDKILTDYKEVNEQYPDNYVEENTIEKIVLPSDFDWQKETRTAIRNAIYAIFKAGIIDKETLVTASKFAGPGNTTAVPAITEPQILGAVLDPKEYALPYALLHYDWETMQVKSDFVLPPPPSKKTRDEEIKLKVGTEFVTREAEVTKYFANLENLQMSAIQAVRVTLERLTGHEYAHAIVYALRSLGKPLYQKIENMPQNDWEREVRSIEDIHEEHFARGVEEVVMRDSLKRLCEYSPEEIDTFLSYGTNLWRVYSDVFTEFFTEMEQKGFTVRDIFEIETKVKKYADPFKKNKFTPIAEMIAYNAPYYSLDQLNHLLHNNA